MKLKKIDITKELTGLTMESTWDDLNTIEYKKTFEKVDEFMIISRDPEGDLKAVGYVVDVHLEVERELHPNSMIEDYRDLVSYTIIISADGNNVDSDIVEFDEKIVLANLNLI